MRFSAAAHPDTLMALLASTRPLYFKGITHVSERSVTDFSDEEEE